MPRLRDKYIVANCCRPRPGDAIVGYFSHDDFIKVHRDDCPNLGKAESSRLVTLAWEDILAPDEPPPDKDYDELTNVDFIVLAHHYDFGVDYSLKVAAVQRLDQQAVFDAHARLRDLGLLRRVEPVMIRYRQKFVKGKWIKHRNHTYYELTENGRRYLDHNEGKAD